MALDTKSLAQYARYDQARKKLKIKYEEFGKKMAEMESDLIDEMISNDVDKVSLKGGTTLYINGLIWAKYIKDPETGKTDKPKVIEALKEAQLDWLIEDSFNSNKVSGYLRELDKNGEELPEALKGVVEANFVPKLTVKKF